MTELLTSGELAKLNEIQRLIDGGSLEPVGVNYLVVDTVQQTTEALCLEQDDWLDLEVGQYFDEEKYG